MFGESIGGDFFCFSVFLFLSPYGENNWTVAKSRIRVKASKFNATHKRTLTETT